MVPLIDFVMKAYVGFRFVAHITKYIKYITDLLSTYYFQSNTVRSFSK